MQYCDKCKVYIDGDRKQCPLCQVIFTDHGDPAAEVFPLIPSNRHRFHLLVRSMAFASSAVVVLSVVLNVLLTPHLLWSVFIAAAAACMWISLASAIRRRHNIPKNILWQVILLSAIAVGWDFFTRWHGWSISYVIPAICVFAMAAGAGCAVFMKLRMDEYMIYLILDALLGIIPLLFLLLGWLEVIYPSVICVAVSVLSFCALFSFAGDEFRWELRKRLHL